MTEQEAKIYRRDKFIPDGVVVARHEIKHGATTYQPSERLPASFREEVGDRKLAQLWRLKMVDTIPAAELEAPKTKPARVKGLA